MSLSKVALGLGALAAAGAAVAFTLQQRAQTGLAEQNSALRLQLTQLQTENAGLSNRLAEAGDFKRRATAQLTELLKLRNDVGSLQRQVGEIGKLREELQRLEAAPHATPAISASLAASDPQQQAALESLNQAKQGVLGFILFAAENQQQFPASFEQAAPYFKEGLEPIAMSFEIVYVGSLSNLTNTAGTIVLREKRATPTREGGWRKTYGFADGHAEIHTEPTGNFDNWESQHLVPPPTNP